MQVFISYCSKDDNKRKALARSLESASPSFTPIVVATRREPGVPLAEKVIHCIRESDYLVPVLTRESVHTQWVNQEIGFAVGIDRKIVPLVERGILHQLKGFLHCQNDIPFTFDGNSLSSRREAASFRLAYLELIEYLQNQRAGTLTSIIKPSRVVAGSAYTTEVSFQGEVVNGFFDNYIEHMGSSFHFYQWDPETLPLSDNVAPGILNGHVAVRRTYTHSTAGWPHGKFRIFVRLYSHPVPGQRGRRVVAENVHHFEVI